MTRHGFTFVELMVVIGILATLFSLTFISLTSAENKADLRGATQTVVSDLHSQQLKGMSGNTEGSGTVSGYGVRIDPHSYTLFRGTYVSGNSANFTIPVTAPLNLTTSFPTSSVIFLPGSGEISGFTPGLNSITLTNASSGESTTILLNQYGVITTPN